jgi:hypothetical protein
MKVAIRRVSLLSLGRLGCLLGVVAAFLPSLLCGLLGLGLTSLVRRWLEGWQEITITLLGRDVASFDLVQLLGLERLLDLLQVLATASGPALFLAVMILALVCGALLAVIVILVGLAYNLLSAASGGLVVEMAALPERQGSE